MHANSSAYTDSLDKWGDSGRKILRGPSQIQYDFMFGKQFVVNGLISSTIGGQRTMQSALRFKW